MTKNTTQLKNPKNEIENQLDQDQKALKESLDKAEASTLDALIKVKDVMDIAAKDTKIFARFKGELKRAMAILRFISKATEGVLKALTRIYQGRENSDRKIKKKPHRNYEAENRVY